MDWNKPQASENLHKVLRLEDTDGDGKFDRKTVFATFEMMAQGVCSSMVRSMSQRHRSLEAYRYR